MKQMKKYPTIGVCGLDCGLCPRYYTIGSSRCPGCCGPDFFNKHPSCSFITCCVKKRGLEVCAECDEFPCLKFKGVGKQDSFLTYKKSPAQFEFRKRTRHRGIYRTTEKTNGITRDNAKTF